MRLSEACCYIYFCTMKALIALTLLAVAHTACALDNGLGRTPMMGFNTWNTFKYGINETLIKQTSDLMVSLGLRDAGYQYVGLDGALKPCACKAHCPLGHVLIWQLLALVTYFPAYAFLCDASLQHTATAQMAGH